MQLINSVILIITINEMQILSQFLIYYQTNENELLQSCAKT